MTTIDEGTASFYDLHAGEYFRATYSRDLSAIWDCFSERIARPARLLDLGCGSGRDSQHFLSRGYSVVGLDASLPLIRLAREHVGGVFVQGDMAFLPFQPRSFNGVWAVGSLLHVPRPDVRGVLCQIHMALAQAGVLLTSLKVGAGEGRDAHGRYNVFYTEREWDQFLRTAGFNVVQASESSGHGLPLRDNSARVAWLTHLAIKI